MLPDAEERSVSPNILGLTRDSLMAMNEAALRDQVIKPLLVAMGLRDVMLWHGGPLEQGKDFVMWEPDRLGREDWVAVVVKAGRLTGSTTGSGSAGDVATQVLQAFGGEFTHPRSAEKIRVRRVWVIASGDIIPTALNAIKSQINVSPQASSSTTFINGDALWELIETHLPARVIVERVTEAVRQLDALDEKWSVSVVGGSKGVTFSVAPRGDNHGPADDVVLTMRLPNTPAGLAAHEDVQRHIRTGEPVRLPGEFVEVKVPDALGFFATPDSEIVEIILPERRFERTLVVDLSFQSDGGARATFAHVAFHCTRAGTMESVFETRDGETAVAFRMHIRLAESKGDIAVLMGRCSRNVATMHRVIELTEIMAAGATVTVVQSDSGLLVFAGNARAGDVPDYPDGLKLLLEAAATIQRVTRVPISFPIRDIPADEVQEVHALAHQLVREEIPGTLQPFTVVVPRTDAVAFLDGGLGQAEGEFLMRRDAVYLLLDANIPTTSWIRPTAPPTIFGPDREAVWTFMAAYPDSDQVPVRLTLHGEAIPVMVRTGPSQPDRSVKAGSQ